MCNIVVYIQINNNVELLQPEGWDHGLAGYVCIILESLHLIVLAPMFSWWTENNMRLIYNKTINYGKTINLDSEHNQKLQNEF